MRTLTTNLKISQPHVTVEGWVNSRRHHGGLIFIDLRDHTGIIQLVITPDQVEAFAIADTIHDEYVVRAIGKLQNRQADLRNPHIPTGDIELVVEELTILNKSAVPPVNTHDDGEKSSEELRLKYRFLDLRRPSMQNILRRRSDYIRFLRDYMYQQGFTEVTTPILANSSPEGARDFLVPSRLHPGKFYALPQAPQQFKQLLMIGGLDRYFQIAPCFRDEDPRADRLYGDFYQLDFEMSFVEDGETVRRTIEPLYRSLVTDFAKKKIVLNSPVVQSFIVPDAPLIPRIPYNFCMETYGTDKPDLRYSMELVDLTDIFAKTDFQVFKTACVKAIRVKNGATLTRREIEEFTHQAIKLGASGLAYILFPTLISPKSPILKFLTTTEVETVKERMHVQDNDAIFFIANERNKVNKILGQLRIAFADHFNLKDKNEFALCWVVDFPFYEWDEKNHKLDFGHNPFSMPKGGLDALEQTVDKLDIVADQYDLVINGYEIGSGAVRNYNPEIMYKAFNLVGYTNEYVESHFGGMLNAFKFGAPPHAGCAPGIDRMFMVLEGLENIRDIVPFPKNGSGEDLMMGAPSTIDGAQLDELNIHLTPTE